MILFLLWQLVLIRSVYIMSTDAFVPKVKPEHVISFGDAIFAFAITFMTLSIDIPDLPANLTESQLLSRLYELYPQVESYIIRFPVVLPAESGHRFPILLQDPIFLWST